MARTKVTMHSKRAEIDEGSDSVMSTNKSYIWKTIGTEDGTNFKVFKFEEFQGNLKQRKRTRSPKQTESEEVKSGSNLYREPRLKCNDCNTIVVKLAKFCHQCGVSLM